MKRIAVMTSGGDSPGMNAAIRSVVRTGLANGIEVFGIEQGYKGMIENKMRLLCSKDVSNMVYRGVTFLRSARCMEFKTEDGQKLAVSNLEKNGIDGLVVIGGDGSLTGAKILAENFGVKVVGLPGSIDNDIHGTNTSIGVDTALNTIVHAIDTINDTASSHDRTFIIEVMGRHCGYLAVMSAIAGGAETALIPEVPYNLENIIAKIRKRYQEGKTRSVIILAEGVGSAYDFGRTLELMGGFETRITVLGHIQRGGSPTYFDRILATRMGDAAVKGLMSGKTSCMTALTGREIELIPLSEIIGRKKQFDANLLKMAEDLST